MGLMDGCLAYSTMSLWSGNQRWGEGEIKAKAILSDAYFIPVDWIHECG